MRICINGIYRDMTKEEEENYLNSEPPTEEPTLEDRVIELEEVNKQQDELINISLLATDEMYMMIEPLLTQTLSISSESKMVNMYVAMVQRELKKREEVPERYREEVIAILEELEDKRISY